jgi:hypothetical protein
MHAVTRTYSGPGAKKLFAELKKNQKAIESLLRPIKGLKSYLLIDTGDGGLSVTVCEDKASIDESVRAAADWIKKNAPNTGASAPAVKEGVVIAQLK